MRKFTMIHNNESVKVCEYTAAVREYIDEDDVVVPAKPKRTAKLAAPKKAEAPVEISPAINTAPVITDGGEESLASKYFGTT